MLFSVIIPTYNRRDLLCETLGSVRAQRFTDYEVIVVDDGSDDGTAEALAAEGDWLRVLGQPNRGPGPARNLGAEAARGDYLAFLDSDDLWFPWTLEVFAELIARHHHPALIMGRYIEFDDQSGFAEVSEAPAVGEAYPDYLASSAMGYFAGAGMFVVDRGIFLRAGGFAADMSCGEDHDLALRLGTARGFVQVKSPLTIAHRRHHGSAASDQTQVLAGLHRLLSAEQDGRFPGGPARVRDRRRVLSLHARPVALQRLKAGDLASAARIYRKTLRWNLADMRLRFVLGFPVLALRQLLLHRLWRDGHAGR